MVAAAAEELALFFHLVGAFLLVAGVTVAGVAFEAARRHRPLAEVALLLGLTRVGVLLVAAGATLTLVFGLWLVDLTGVGLGAAWVDAALALFAAMAVLGALGGRRPKQARRLAEHSEGEQQVRALLADRPTLLANYLSAAVAVAILALMVFRPGG